MWETILPAVGANIGNIVGGVLNKKAADNAAQANKDMAADNQNLQREFAQNGIRWKVEDAKAAGIHPLVGLGASTHSFSPMAIGATPDTSMGDMARNMGQDISRAVSATRTQDERTISALQIKSAQLDLDGKALDNQIKQTQLNKLSATGPALPGSSSFISGQGNSGAKVIEKPLERTASLAGAPNSEAGAIPGVGWETTGTGLVPVPSNDVKQRIEDNLFHETRHFMSNNLAPNFGSGPVPPASALPKGATKWKWNYLQQEFQPYFPPKGGSSRPVDMRSKKLMY